MDKVEKTPEDCDEKLKSQFIADPTFWTVFWFVAASVAKATISFITFQFLRPVWDRFMKWRKGENGNTEEVPVDQIVE